jgi:hypothetical protein
MFRVIVLFASLLCASAFRIVNNARARSSLRMSFENEPGVLKPTGYFDPLGNI